MRLFFITYLVMSKHDGLIYVLTGNGKGKTTCAIGMAICEAYKGNQVFIAQFVKGLPYSEHSIIKSNFNLISLKTYGLDCFIEKDPTNEDVLAAKKGLKEVKEIIVSGNYKLVILDEANIALYYHLLETKELINIIKNRPNKVSIIITGRKAPNEILNIADSVTEVKELKHYYSRGIDARKGIEY